METSTTYLEQNDIEIKINSNVNNNNSNNSDNNSNNSDNNNNNNNNNYKLTSIKLPDSFDDSIKLNKDSLTDSLNSSNTSIPSPVSRNINYKPESIFLKEKISSVNSTPIKSNLSKVLKDNNISPTNNKFKFNKSQDFISNNKLEGALLEESPNNNFTDTNNANNPMIFASNLVKSKRFSTVSNIQGFQCTIYLSETLGGSSKHSIKMFIKHEWTISRAIDETIKLAYEKYDITITQEIDQLCMYVADEDGSIDTDYPCLDNDQIASNTGINGFVLSTKLLIKQLSLNIANVKRFEENSTTKSPTGQCCWF